MGLVVAFSGCSTLAPIGWVPSTWRSDEQVRQCSNVEARKGNAAGPSGPDSASRRVSMDPAEALDRLGVLEADPTSGMRDYRAARTTFTRLLSEYPRSRRDPEARAWQATLTDLLVREDEARRALQRLQHTEEERAGTPQAGARQDRTPVPSLHSRSWRWRSASPGALGARPSL